MKTTRRIIEELAMEYLNDEDYQKGFINYKWVFKITEELKLEELSDLELSNMWDMVWMTLECEYTHHRINEDWDKAMPYLDVQSAFTEVVNREARRRREEKGSY